MRLCVRVPPLGRPARRQGAIGPGWQEEALRAEPAARPIDPVPLPAPPKANKNAPRRNTTAVKQ